VQQENVCATMTFAVSKVVAWGPDSPAAKEYIAGPDDQLSVDVLNLEEIGPQFMRKDMQGNINGALAAPD